MHPYKIMIFIPVLVFYSLCVYVFVGYVWKYGERNRIPVFDHRFHIDVKFSGNVQLAETEAPSKKVTNAPTSTKSVSTTTTEFPELPLLTLFTTWNESMERNSIYENTLKVWGSLRPRVNLILFMDHNNKIAVNSGWQISPLSETECGGVPSLRGMFLDAMNKSESTFYAFANGDILFNEGIIDTLSSLRKHELYEIDDNILLIGKRVDLLLDKFKISRIKSYQEVNQLALKGTMGNGYSEDYFITTKTFPWDEVPEVVIGRNTYNNFLVFYARTFLNTTLIDSSSSIFALHQKSVKRKRSYSRCNEDILRRHKLYKKRYIQLGNLECAPFESRYNRKGKVVFYRRGLFTTKCH